MTATRPELRINGSLAWRDGVDATSELWSQIVTSSHPPDNAAANGRAPEAGFRVVALYLPQFHPIPENDVWWGPGFTEWTNVARARPLFRGHFQPNLPGELGFYDLRLPETRAVQAALAQTYGVEAFCYWHYWFGGERLLERPFAEVLASGEPGLSFCLAWANQSWTGIWHGAPHRMLKEQTYPGQEDVEAHFHAVAPALHDSRSFRVDGRPLFGIFRPTELPDAQRFIETWRRLADREGLPGIYFVGFTDDPAWRPADDGYDAAVLFGFSGGAQSIRRGTGAKVTKRLKRLSLNLGDSARTLLGHPLVFDYEEVRPERIFGTSLRSDIHPCVVPNWDNTPRSGRNGRVLFGATPEAFRGQLEVAARLVSDRPHDSRLLFIKSWNEWAEGNYLEPDQRFGRGWLEAVADVQVDAGVETFGRKGVAVASGRYSAPAELGRTRPDRS